MINTLIELYNSNKNASFYTDTQETTKFHFGKVIAINENELALALLSNDGEDDGITIIDPEKVFRVEYDGQYFKKMNKLCILKKINFENYTIDNSNILVSFLHILKEQHEIVSIELVNSGLIDICGFIHTYKNNKCIIKQIDEYGFDDGFSTIFIKDITQITFKSKDEKRIKFLYQSNKTKENNKNSIIDITDEELEKWYDKLYQLLLFCVLIKDNLERIQSCFS